MQKVLIRNDRPTKDKSECKFLGRDSKKLRINPVQGSGEGDGFADVVEVAEPGYDSLDAHAET